MYLWQLPIIGRAVVLATFAYILGTALVVRPWPALIGFGIGSIASGALFAVVLADALISQLQLLATPGVGFWALLGTLLITGTHNFSTLRNQMKGGNADAADIFRPNFT